MNYLIKLLSIFFVKLCTQKLNISIIYFEYLSRNMLKLFHTY